MFKHTVAMLLASVPTALVGMTSASAAYVLNPYTAGSYAQGLSATAEWVQVQKDWRGLIYGQNADYDDWNTGIWGLADALAALALPADDDAVVRTYSGTTTAIAYADQRYLDTWASKWGTQSLAPILTGTASDDQDNWAVQFLGDVSIAEPGYYNFGVMVDDGFRFRLIGAGGQQLQLLVDGLNPRDRHGFDENLLLFPGVYQFELISWERLEAGVVNLDWFQVARLPAPVGGPPTWALLAGGLVGVAVRRIRRGRAG